MHAGCTISGRGTNYSAMAITQTPGNMNLNSVAPNWVRGLATSFDFMHFLCAARCVFTVLCVNDVCVHWRTTQWLGFAGQLLWRRLPVFPLPSHHTVRSACMQLLPLVEMFCKWELQEDCTNLRALMLRFDSEADLKSHELGRSLLFLVRDEDGDLDGLPTLHRIERTANPFEVVRERLAAVSLAIQDLQPQVHLVSDYSATCNLLAIIDLSYTYIRTWHAHLHSRP